MRYNENNCSNVSPSMSSSSNIPVAISPCGWKVSPTDTECFQFQQYPCSYIAEWLKGEFCHIAGISASCSLRQTVYAVFELTVWSRALKDSSASLAFEGAGLLSSSRLNAASVDLLIVVRTQAEWSNQHRRCAHILYQFGKFRKFWFYAANLTSSHSVAIIICKDIKLSSMILQKSFQRSCKENDQIK